MDSPSTPPAPASTPAVPRPLGMTGRAIAPDLARGVMLLFIVIANAPWYLWAAETRLLSSHPVEGSVADRVAQTVALIAIDGRTYPMFAALFGYGIWQLYRRQADAGVPEREARRLLRRRHWWMVAFGAVHALLLWMGDVIGAYGLAGLVLVALFIRRADRTLKIWAIVLTSLLALGAVLSAAGGVIVAGLGAAEVDSTEASFEFPDAAREPDYLTSALIRIGFWLVLAPGQGLIGLVVPVAILAAIVAARHRVLEQPEAHLPLLRRTALIGIGSGWAVGALVAAQNLNLLGLPAELDWALLAAHSLTGLFCGLGYVALFGLMAVRLQRRDRPSAVAGALQAVGKRSLTFYLAQSVVFAPVMSAWGLGLGAQLSSWSITVFAIATWMLTVAIAVVLERRGVRGPAEWLLRRLAYPRSSSAG